MEVDIQKLCDDFRATGGLVGTTATHPAKIVVNGERTAANCSDPKKTKEEQQRHEKEKRKNPKLKHDLAYQTKKKGARHFVDITRCL